VCVRRVYLESCRVGVNNDRYLSLDLEEIPTKGLPVWFEGRGLSGKPSPLKWTVSTNFENYLFPQYLGGSAYTGWSMRFVPELVAEVVDMAAGFTGADPLVLLVEIRQHIHERKKS